MSHLFCNIGLYYTFYCNGNSWVKVSSRTARIINSAYTSNGKVYYFRDMEKVSLIIVPTIKLI